MWPWRGHSIHSRCLEYHIFSCRTLHITSAGRCQRSSVRSQTLIERADRRFGRHCSLRDLYCQGRGGADAG